MKKFITTVVFAAALATTAPAAPETPRAGGIIREIARELFNLREQAGLTDQQRAGVKSILKSHKPEIAAQITSGRDARRAMHRAVESSGPESAETLKAADAVAAAARNRALLTARIASEIRPLLTAEQVALAKATRERIEESVDARFSGFSE